MNMLRATEGGATVRVRAFAGAAVMALMSGWAADAAAQAAEPEAVTEVIVTGSRIRGVAPVGSNIVSVGREQFEETTGATITDILRQVPQISSITMSSESTRTATGIANTTRNSAIDLRGLGVNATLPLFDGRRLVRNGVTAGFIDPNSLPTNFIARVEVVPDGSSAIYGSDALAGVVNLVPRKSFDGLEFRTKLGFADGYDSQQFSVIGGLNWESGNFVGAYEYTGNSPLRGVERDKFGQDQRARGGRDYRVSTCEAGNLIIGGVSYAIPASGTVTPASLLPNTRNLCDILRPTDILFDQERHSFAFYVDQELTENLEVFAEAFAFRRKHKTRVVATGSQLLTVTAALPRTNAFFVNPAGASTSAPVTLEYLFGPSDYPDGLIQSGRTQVAQISGGVRAQLPFDWDAEMSGTYGRAKDDYFSNNLNNAARVAAWASSNPATAFNPFGQTNPTVLANIKTGQFAPWAWTTLEQYEVSANGPLFSLPAGQIRAAVGLEYTRNRLKGGATRGTLTAPVLGAITLTSQSAKSVYGEVVIPVFGPENAMAGFHRLDLSIAGRYDDYSDVGVTRNPKVGFTWAPVEGINLRGSYGTSFRAAPGLNDPIKVIAAGIYPQTLQDPLSPTGQSNGFLVRGGNPDLGPESAKSYSLGAEYAPASIPLRASITWWKIKWDDRIVSIAPSPTVQPLVQTELYGFLVTRNPTQAQINALFATGLPIAGALPANPAFIVDTRFLNLGSLEASGFDIQAAYAFPETSLGSFDLTAFAAITSQYDEKPVPTSPVLDNLGNIGTPARFRGRATLGWTNGPWRATGSGNFYSRYDNTTVTPVQKVDSNVTLDAHLSYTFDGQDMITRGLQLSLDVSNLFDNDPPFVDISGGYDPGAASILGRYVTVGISKRF